MRTRIFTGLYIVITFFCFLLQTTLFKTVNFGGISPDLLVITTTSIGFMKGEKSGMLAGFFSGLMVDIFFGNILGFYALLYMLLGYLNGLFCRIYYPEDLKLPLLLITLSDFTYGLVCYFCMFILRGRFDFNWHLMNVILPETIYTLIVGIVLYPLLLLLYRKMHMDEDDDVSYL